MNQLDLFNTVYKNKTVLVTGDTGFKGSWMCIWLHELGAKVHGYALKPINQNDNSITTKLGDKISHQDGDIRDLTAFTAYVKQVNPDIIFHLAAQPLVIESYHNPHYNFETNVMGTVNFFEAVRQCPSIKVAINVTTDKCYQNNEWLWGYRENEAMGGDDPYSASKGCSELITQSYTKSFFTKNSHTAVASARAGNVIGGGDWAENRIIPDIFRAYQSDQPLTIRNAQSIRPWQFVLEPLYGYLKLAEKLWNEPQKYIGGWNFGPATYENYSVLDVVNELKKSIPKLKVEQQQNTKKLHEAALLKLDVTKAINLLKWAPKLNFEQTIKFTMNGYMSEIEKSTNLYQNRVEQIAQYCNH